MVAIAFHWLLLIKPLAVFSKEPPDAPNPPRLVYDDVGILSGGDRSEDISIMRRAVFSGILILATSCPFAESNSLGHNARLAPR